ncbi:putative chitinase KNAG_0C04870 [Huiozyma naganishii CBS 8797]|uniref:chitinase n=1 Tax=Huiozyma naganishii (strain ATCC MYA-139 / BCRC 22969 / CBS 8797 / KCTC 17520 / NBRC 10181 / NCYC 3082 / Yp74L-3) TaxID=1071383 RepID=J7RJ91_HUIN7|nr:hypothetical protein KNAG_0C04870 [Kazachstania naganishii CBS 8797]CCK69588.1 hypothetical protein KNAG_0C04870 [Kazachstania naganishii CBS 8797]
MKRRQKITIAAVSLVSVTVILTMCFTQLLHKKTEHHHQPPAQCPQNVNQKYVSGVYYSDWSPYEPRMHFPKNIDTSKITHIYYSFFLVDADSSALKLGDSWSDIEMPMGKNTVLKGCIGALNSLRDEKPGFKNIMAVGGWSNKDAFPLALRKKHGVEKLAQSCVETMFQYGFDGIDLDWEYPKDDGKEPRIYLELMRKIRQHMNELEIAIWGDKKRRFHLSVATPAFYDKLETFPIKEMDQYIDYWNMMTYDYYGEWSSGTGFHSNLYDGTNKFSEHSLCADGAIRYMTNKIGINSRKVVLGMALYGRGFTNVKEGDPKKTSGLINRKFKGVGGESEGEPGMWLYNQLPIRGTQEVFDEQYGSAYCFDPKTKTLVGYDNVDSTRQKAQYVRFHNLAGGFWWESCGNKWDNVQQSLVHVFNEDIERLDRNETNLYQDPKLREHYLQIFAKSGFLAATFK